MKPAATGIMVALGAAALAVAVLAAVGFPAVVAVLVAVALLAAGKEETKCLYSV